MSPSAVVRVVRKGFCRNSEWFDPEEDALRSEALDKDPLIRSRGCILLSTQQENVSACRIISIAWRTNWVKTIIVMYYGSPNIAANKTRPTITQCSTRQ